MTLFDTTDASVDWNAFFNRLRTLSQDELHQIITRTCTYEVIPVDNNRVSLFLKPAAGFCFQDGSESDMTGGATAAEAMVLAALIAAREVFPLPAADSPPATP